MQTSEIFSLLLLLAGAWFLWDSLKAREAAIGASRALCKAEGLQFLDETVAIDSVRPVRDQQRRMRLRRVYGFEYSDTGNNRHKGSVTLIGDTVITLNIGPRPVPERETLH
ncbi:MAG: DUF3301 domain-containing protein [Burkholderiales bacterium]|nr:DUF3301 domain-containing protein [Burkholderiales bacterium]